METKKPIFSELSGDDTIPEITEISSLCMNCHANGTTRLLLTKIPFYKEVVLMSFNCDECGYENNEIQSGAPVASEGVRYTLQVTKSRDINRQMVKSDFASVRIVELDFEVPANSQKGEVTTVEGIISRCMMGLEQDQTFRRVENPEIAIKIDNIIENLKKLKNLEKPFTLVLEDVSGNSFIENPNAPHPDVNCRLEYFQRSKEQDHIVGIYSSSEISNDEKQIPGILKPISENDFTLEDFQSEVLRFPTNCSSCGSPCETNMKLTKIPHFKEVVIMATTCDVCGHRTNEVKPGGGIEPKGVLIEVTVSDKEDFSRDVLKSETCHLKIPELDLDVGPHALGGRFTTVEGLIVAIKDQLKDPKYSLMFGDSQTDDTKNRLKSFLNQIDQILECKLTITVVLNDPAGNSYIQKINDEDDKLKVTQYERTYDQNEELGLNDIKTENY